MANFNPNILKTGLRRIQNTLGTARNGLSRIGINLPLDIPAGLYRIKLRLLGNENLIQCYNAATRWIENHSQPDGGIAVTSRNQVSYPEVTGYYIPTLLNWGQRDLAIRWARWLVSIQDEDGSWRDHHHTRPYTFDTGQILKGLMALVDSLPEYRKAIIRGCDWILKQTKSSGRITTPDTSQWPRWRGQSVPEAIHLYCMEPIREAGKKWGRDDYLEKVDRSLGFYLAQDDLIEFMTLSHFHAYVTEALVDLDVLEQANESMAYIEKLQRRYGFVPAYRDVHWVCSTGLLQYAVIWYKLGMKELADEAFAYACSLQNDSGGFFGSYGVGAHYFPRQEISWAVKYFLDALYWKIRRSFDTEADLFPDSIEQNDGRFQIVDDAFKRASPSRILDIGCGKGRFLKRLIADYSGVEAYGLDLSDKMLKYLPSAIKSLQGSLYNIPYPDSFFDFAFCIETLEYAVNFPLAIREMGRVVAPGGVLIIIGKNQEKLGASKTFEWEQWLQGHEIRKLLREEGFSVAEHRGISQERGSGEDNLFIGWVAKKDRGG